MLFSTKVEQFLLYRCKASFTFHSSWDKIESLESKNYALNCPSSLPFSHRQINPVQTRLQLKLVIILPLFFDRNKIVPFQTLFQSLTFPTGRKFLLISSLNTLLTSPCPADPVPRLSVSFSRSFQHAGQTPVLLQPAVALPLCHRFTMRHKPPSASVLLFH